MAHGRQQTYLLLFDLVFLGADDSLHANKVVVVEVDLVLHVLVAVVGVLLMLVVGTHSWLRVGMRLTHIKN